MKPAHNRNRIPIKELLDKKFGRLTIIGEAEPHIKPSGKSSRMIKCVCDCGNKTTALLDSLRSGHTQSCGCYRATKVKEAISTHKLSGTPIYSVWKCMRMRCTNPNNKGFKYYGGRGIKVCEEWQNDFINFYNWSMSNGYEEGLEIDRIDNNGNYEPTNCRWVTHLKNSRNKPQIKLSIEEAQDIRNAYSLKCFTQKEIAEAYKISKTMISQIINNSRWI